MISRPHPTFRRRRQSAILVSSLQGNAQQAKGAKGYPNWDQSDKLPDAETIFGPYSTFRKRQQSAMLLAGQRPTSKTRKRVSQLTPKTIDCRMRTPFLARIRRFGGSDNRLYCLQDNAQQAKSAKRYPNWHQNS